MNIAISTLFLFVFLIPGITFRRFYYSEEFTKDYKKKFFFSLIASSFLPALFFHAGWYFLIQAPIFGGYQINFEVISQLLAPRANVESLKAAFKNIEEYSWQILWYFISICSAALLAGVCSKYIVRKLKFDWAFEVFRYSNYWFYVLRGELFGFRKSMSGRMDEFLVEKTLPIDVRLIFIQITSVIAGKPILYEGFYIDLEVDDFNNPKTIFLTQVSKRFLFDKDDYGNIYTESQKYYLERDQVEQEIQHRKESGEEVGNLSEEKEWDDIFASPPMKIKGNFIAIPFDRIENLTCSFYQLEEKLVHDEKTEEVTVVYDITELG